MGDRLEGDGEFEIGSYESDSDFESSTFAKANDNKIIQKQIKRSSVKKNAVKVSKKNSPKKLHSVKIGGSLSTSRQNRYPKLEFSPEVSNSSETSDQFSKLEKSSEEKQKLHNLSTELRRSPKGDRQLQKLPRDKEKTSKSPRKSPKQQSKLAAESLNDREVPKEMIQPMLEKIHTNKNTDSQKSPEKQKVSKSPRPSKVKLVIRTSPFSTRETPEKVTLPSPVKIPSKGNTNLQKSPKIKIKSPAKTPSSSSKGRSPSLHKLAVVAASAAVAPNSKPGESSKGNAKRKLLSEYFSAREPESKRSLQPAAAFQSISDCAMDLLADVRKPVNWKKIAKPQLDLDYAVLFGKRAADSIFNALEKETEYYTGDLTKLRVFGKWHTIPRKQVAYGDEGITYTFSGVTLPAKPWTKLLVAVRDLLASVTSHRFNFVLINRYKDGEDHIGEHRDDEKDLVANAPIASLSFGQHRDFIFRHAQARNKATRGHLQPELSPLSIVLEHGSLLIFNPPTNQHWFHSLPVRKRASNPRINLTFRHMKLK